MHSIVCLLLSEVEYLGVLIPWHPDVVNGQKNMLTVTLEKVSDRNVTVTRIAGALLDPDTNALIKNVRTESGDGS